MESLRVTNHVIAILLREGLDVFFHNRRPIGEVV